MKWEIRASNGLQHPQTPRKNAEMQKDVMFVPYRFCVYTQKINTFLLTRGFYASAAVISGRIFKLLYSMPLKSSASTVQSHSFSPAGPPLLWLCYPSTWLLAHPDRRRVHSSEPIGWPELAGPAGGAKGVDQLLTVRSVEVLYRKWSGHL